MFLLLSNSNHTCTCLSWEFSCYGHLFFFCYIGHKSPSPPRKRAPPPPPAPVTCFLNFDRCGRNQPIKYRYCPDYNLFVPECLVDTWLIPTSIGGSMSLYMGCMTTVKSSLVSYLPPLMTSSSNCQ